ncbi:MAG: GNAT family N-acetyltransferase [Verrucomicrobiota bacterium]
MNLTITPMTSSDWERTRTIRFRALQDHPDAFGSTLEREFTFTDQDWKDRLSRPRCQTFIASCDERDVGLIRGGPYDDEAGLFSMWVAPEARRQGVAGRLVDVIIAWAVQQEKGKLLLDVGDANESAIRLYESKGFLPTGVIGTLPPPREHITEHQRAISLPTS